MQLKTKNATFATQSNPYQNMRYNSNRKRHTSVCLFLFTLGDSNHFMRQYRFPKATLFRHKAQFIPYSRAQFVLNST